MAILHMTKITSKSEQFLVGQVELVWLRLSHMYGEYSLVGTGE